MPSPAHAFQTDDARLKPIAEKVAAQQRLDAEDALALYRSQDILAVGWMANLVGEPPHGENVARAIQRQRVAGVKTLLGDDFLGDRLQPRVVGLKCMGRRRHPLNCNLELGICNFQA